MWHRVISENSNFFYKCDVKETDNVIECCWTDLVHVWREVRTLEEACARATRLNRRIEYTKAIILSTIVKVPEAVVPEGSTNGAVPSKDSMDLKLRYTINQLPFNFTWQMTLCSRQEYFLLFTKPLLLCLSGLKEQNSDLRKLIIQKDVELKQYKEEGAVLKRTLVATQPFDPDVFDEKYPKTESDQIVEYSSEQFEQLKRDCDAESKESQPNLNIPPTTSKTKRSKARSSDMHFRPDRKRERKVNGETVYEEESSSSEESCDRNQSQKRRIDPPLTAKNRVRRKFNF